MEDDIYQEHIMDHYQHPRNKTLQKKPTYQKTQLNPLCGDELTIQITNKNGKMEDISFQGHGCAISQASASILTEFLKKKPLGDLEKITEKDMLNLLHIPISHTRTKCALLALKTAKAALPIKENQKNKPNKKTTKESNTQSTKSKSTKSKSNKNKSTKSQSTKKKPKK